AGVRREQEETLALSRSIPVWFNASTATPGDFERLVGMGMRTEGIGISHNFYPKPYTGLSDEFLLAQTRMFHELGLTVQPWVPGDGVRRIPLGSGLPTLERHRDPRAVAAAGDLSWRVWDAVFVGAPSLSERSRRAWGAWVQEGFVELEVELTAPVPEGVVARRAVVGRNRTDDAAAMVRLEGARSALADVSIPPTATVGRAFGSVTVDNDAAGGYKGEYSVLLRDLTADETVSAGW